jgi:hypothetical protein
MVTMQNFEREWFDAWLAGVKACDTDDDYEAKKKAQEEAVWLAVDNYDIGYVDVVNSWLVEAGDRIRNSDT